MENTWNKKIVANRDPKWTQKMVKTKMRLMEKPSKLRSARLKKELSQPEMSKRAKLTATTYGAIERGQRKVKEPVAELLSKLVGGDVKKLFVTTAKSKLVARF